MLAGAGLSQAGSFGISPVRVDLSAKRPNGSVQVTNNGQVPVTVQVHAARWAMKGAENAYSETADFIVNPPVFAIQPGRTQLVRIGLRTANPAAVERSYRLILEEVPKPGESGMIAIVLNVSLPVFIQPGTPAAPKLQWRALRKDGNSFQLAVTNNGSAHDRIQSVSIETERDKIEVPISGYVLPGDSRDVMIRDERLSGAQRFDLVTTSEAGSTRIQLTPQSVTSPN
jgi:fimbrial chaperone protein